VSGLQRGARPIDPRREAIDRRARSVHVVLTEYARSGRPGLGEPPTLAQVEAVLLANARIEQYRAEHGVES
jgi:hypothetical protein